MSEFCIFDPQMRPPKATENEFLAQKPNRESACIAEQTNAEQAKVTVFDNDFLLCTIVES